MIKIPPALSNCLSYDTNQAVFFLPNLKSSNGYINGYASVKYASQYKARQP